MRRISEVFSLVFALFCPSFLGITQPHVDEVWRRIKEGGIVVQEVVGGEAYDSRGKKTVFARVNFGKGMEAVEATPAGASTGTLEGFVKPSEEALDSIKRIGDWMRRQKIKAGEQDRLDIGMRVLDGTSNLKNLGANATIAVSMAFAKASAKAQSKYLWQYLQEKIKGATPGRPWSFSNFGNGGKHFKGKLSGYQHLEFQEIMVVPLGAKSARQALEWKDMVFAKLGELIRNDPSVTLIETQPYGDEAGWAPLFDEAKLKVEGLDKVQKYVQLVIEAIKQSGLTPGKDMAIAFDVAANTLQENAGLRIAREYLIKKSNPLWKDFKIDWYLTDDEISHLFILLAGGVNDRAINYLASFYYRRPDAGYLFEGKVRTTEEMIEYYERLVKNYPIISIEDPLSEWDSEIVEASLIPRRGWEEITALLEPRGVEIIADDLVVSSPELAQKGIERGSFTGAIAKPNQNGLLEGERGIFRFIEILIQNGKKVIVSHRSGEVVRLDDQPWISTFIADLAYAFHAWGLKAGGVASGYPERREKYQRLIEIEENEQRLP